MICSNKSLLETLFLFFALGPLYWAEIIMMVSFSLKARNSNYGD